MARIENDLTFARQGTIIEEFVGYQTYNDMATQTTPFELTLADTWYTLPNDGLGEYTDTKNRVLGKPAIWDPSTNSLYLKDLYIGGLQILRTSVYFTSPSANAEVSLRLLGAAGTVAEYELPIDNKFLKRSGFEYHFGPTTFFTMDNDFTIQNPMYIQAMSDTAGVSAKVEGWKIATFDRY